MTIRSLPAPKTQPLESAIAMLNVVHCYKKRRAARRVLRPHFPKVYHEARHDDYLQKLKTRISASCNPKANVRHYLADMNYFVTAIGTDSGKTLTSAILCEALGADYWKPVQAGLPRDTDTAKKLIRNSRTQFHPERYLLSMPASPHAAARHDRIKIELPDFRPPQTGNHLIIEGAGGCLVPLNDEDLMIDLIEVLKAEVIVVSNHYLGSINHTLLTLESLNRRNLPVKGLIFNREANPESERIILHRSGLRCLLRIGNEPSINVDTVTKYADLLNKTWNE